MPEGLLRFVTTIMVFGLSIITFIQTIWVDRASPIEHQDTDLDRVYRKCDYIKIVLFQRFMLR